MNTVLSAPAPDTSATHKIKPSHQAVDSTPSTDDASGFAGVLANQAAPQTQSTSTPSSGTTTGSSTGSSSSKSADSDANIAQQQAGHARHSGDTDHATAREAVSRLTHSQQGAALEQIRGQQSPATATQAVNDGTEASLPQRFAQIIAAMEKTGARQTSQPLNDADSDVRQALSGGAGNASNAASADPRSRFAARLDRAATTDGAALAGDRKTPGADISAQPSTLSDGRYSFGQFIADADADSFIMTESHRLPAEGRSGSALHGTIATPDSLLNAVAAGTGFSLTPGQVQSGDVMTSSATLNQPLFSKQWGPELGRQFVSLIRPGENGSHIAELRLDPPELGPLRVTININDSVVQAMFTSAHANVRSAVEQALPQLQQQLEQEGLSLGQTSVGHDDDASQAHSYLAKTSTSRGRNEPEVSTASAPVHQRVSDALVDTFA